MKKTRILFATNYNANDTTSYLRAWGPFTLMRDLVEIVEPLQDLGDKNALWFRNWRNWFNCDVCFLHRPFGPFAAQIMAECKLAGVPLWIDHDDDLLAIPESNPHYKVHADSEKQFPSVEMSYKYADILTCSGILMKKRLEEKHGRKDATLITSGLDDRLRKFKKPFSVNNGVGWRGSKSHLSDLRAFQAPIKRLMERFKDKQWHYWGLSPTELSPNFDKIPNWLYEDQLNYFPYINSITKANCSLHFVPLEDNYFNRVKSNLSWLDATLAGSVVLGPDFEEWKLPGIFKYKNINHFESMFYSLLDISPKILKEKHDESWDYIQKNLMQSKLNEKRYEILEKLGMK